MRIRTRHFGILVCSLLVTVAGYAQSGNSDQFGIGIKAGLLGGGIEAAGRVTQRTNVRAGFDMFQYSRTFNKDGVAYGGQLSLKNVEAHYDIYPFGGGFRISPGALFNIGTPITANANVPSGQSFTLGGQTYYSDTTVPVTGNGTIKWNRAAPMATFGWGNLIPRKDSKHFSIPVELGVAFQGTPKATLNLAGNVCAQPGVNCRSVASDPTVQANIQSEQNKLNNSMSLFKAYPIISVGVGYKF